MLFFVRALREVWGQIARVLLASVTIFLIIVFYLIFFSYAGHILFANNELDSGFSDLWNSGFTVFVMFTLSTYP